MSDIGGENGAKGIILHTTLAVDPTKKHPEIIGLLDQYIHHRTNKVDKNETYAELQDRWRESNLWQEASKRISMEDSKTQIIEVMDREGDVFDITQNCISLKHDFVIRAKSDLSATFSSIKIKGPKNRKSEIINCNVVYVVEKNPPEHQEPLEWVLLTSVEVNSFKDACQIVEWYKCRWIIEEYHKAIKS